MQESLTSAAFTDMSFILNSDPSAFLDWVPPSFECPADVDQKVCDFVAPARELFGITLYCSRKHEEGGPGCEADPLCADEGGECEAASTVTAEILQKQMKVSYSHGMKLCMLKTHWKRVLQQMHWKYGRLNGIKKILNNPLFVLLRLGRSSTIDSNYIYPAMLVLELAASLLHKSLNCELVLFGVQTVVSSFQDPGVQDVFLQVVSCGMNTKETCVEACAWNALEVDCEVNDSWLSRRMAEESIKSEKAICKMFSGYMQLGCQNVELEACSGNPKCEWDSDVGKSITPQ